MTDDKKRTDDAQNGQPAEQPTDTTAQTEPAATETPPPKPVREPVDDRHFWI